MFERADQIGGLPRYGIPEFKLEKRRLDRRLKQMRSEGTIFRAGTEVGVDYTVYRLRSRFDAVILAGGAPVPRDLPIADRDLRGIYLAMEYLTWANRVQQGDGAASPIAADGLNVVIIGGETSGRTASAQPFASRRGPRCTSTSAPGHRIVAAHRCPGRPTLRLIQGQLIPASRTEAR